MQKHNVKLSPLIDPLIAFISGIKHILYLSGLLVLALPVQAASFDCAKAATKVEKFICTDAVLSKLDEELNAAYKAALQDGKQAEAIRQAQKQWMKERNECSDAGCVQSAYQKRIGQLSPAQDKQPIQVQTAASQPQAVRSGDANTDGAEPGKKYPPYPDVWDWVLPDREIISERGVQLVGMDTGDILFMYTTHDKNDKWKSTEPLTLFGHLSVTDKNAGSLIAGHDLPVVHLSDGTSARLESAADVDRYISQGIPLQGGRKLYQASFTPIGPAYSNCYFGPAHFLYGINGPDRKQIKGVAIFKLLDKPKHIDPGEGCMSDAKESFTTRVESIDASLGFGTRPLADGGFVMEVDKGILIRFDKDFNSRSPLINDKYFVLDDTGPSPLGLDGYIYIERITGKTYREGPEYPYDYQSVVDDLYNYLISLKSKKGAAK